MLFDWVIFDAMGVVFEVGDDVNDLLVPFLRERDASIESDGVNRLYRYASLGEISSHGFWNELGFGDAYPGIEREYLGSRLRLDGEFANVAQSLRQEHSLAMLSNDIAEWSRFLRQHHGLDEVFSVSVISGEVGCRKPDRRIYEIALDRLGAKPDACVFIDDRRANLDAATETGMATVLLDREGLEEPSTANARIASLADIPAAVAQLERQHP